MRRILITIMLIITSLVGSGQSDSLFIPRYMVGGNIFVQSQQIKQYYNHKTVDTYYTISPSFGVYIQRNLIVGVHPSISKIKYIRDWEGEIVEYKLALPVFLRYQNKLWRGSKYYADLHMGTVIDFKGGNITEYYSRLNFGAMYYLGKRTSIELNVLSVSYTTIQYLDYSKKKHNLEIIYNVSNPNIGIYYSF